MKYTELSKKHQRTAIQWAIDGWNELYREQGLNVEATENTPEQTRAIFTTLCFVGYIDADTAECDNILLALYNEAAMEEIMEYDEFEMFMVSLIA